MVYQSGIYKRKQTAKSYRCKKCGKIKHISFVTTRKIRPRKVKFEIEEWCECGTKQ
jgi:hypothetical protein